MAMAGNDRDDLSVRLDWPVDPLTTPPATERETSSTRLAERLADLETSVAGLGGAAAEDIAARVEYMASEVVDVLREMTDTLRRALDDTAAALQQTTDENIAALDDRVTGLRTGIMAMLASRQAEEQRTQRREREAVVTQVAEQMNSISRTLTEAIAASRTQSDIFADRVAAELQSLRRRIPVKGRDTATIDEAAIDELVARVADEVEIRVASALKPKPRRSS